VAVQFFSTSSTWRYTNSSQHLPCYSTQTVSNICRVAVHYQCSTSSTWQYTNRSQHLLQYLSHVSTTHAFNLYAYNRPLNLLSQAGSLVKSGLYVNSKKFDTQNEEWVSLWIFASVIVSAFNKEYRLHVTTLKIQTNVIRYKCIFGTILQNELVITIIIISSSSSSSSSIQPLG